MRGVDVGEVREVISSVFTPSEFDMFLFEKLDYDRQNHVANGPFSEVVLQVIRGFEHEGRDPYLIAAVAAVRPLRRDVLEIYHKYAEALLTEAQRQTIEVEKLELLDKYGLVPRVDVQQAGQSQYPSTVPATFEGFQKQVKRVLPFLEPRPWYAQYVQNEQRVCRIEIAGQAKGTGFLVGEMRHSDKLSRLERRDRGEIRGQADRLPIRLPHHGQRRGIGWDRHRTQGRI